MRNILKEKKDVLEFIKFLATEAEIILLNGYHAKNEEDMFLLKIALKVDDIFQSQGSHDNKISYMADLTEERFIKDIIDLSNIDNKYKLNDFKYNLYLLLIWWKFVTDILDEENLDITEKHGTI